MMVVTVHPKAFGTATAKAAKKSGTGAGIRRPTRGIVLKEDTFATLKVVTSSGTPKYLVDAGSRALNQDNSPLEVEFGGKIYRATDQYSNFLIQQVNEDRQEKQQILETFGEPYIFLFGERARVLNIQGVLINTWDFNWEAEWWHNYENFLRGTKCVENDAMVFLNFDNTIVGGYIISSSAVKSAQDRHAVQFQFSLFVTFYSNYSEIGNPYADGMRTREMMNENGKFQMGQNDVTFTISSDEAKAMRPPLIEPWQYAQQWKIDGLNIMQPDLFLSVQQFAVNPLKKAWSFANDAVTKATTRLAGAMQLESGMVEVPYGFAGSMAYDDASLSEAIRQVKVGGKAVYSTFDKNDDEYVDANGQYGSSDPRMFSQYDSGSDLWKQIGEGDDASSKAAKIWGVPSDSEALGPISSGISKGGMGMIVVQGADGELVSWETQEKTFDFKSLGTNRILNAAGARIPDFF